MVSNISFHADKLTSNTIVLKSNSSSSSEDPEVFPGQMKYMIPQQELGLHTVALPVGHFQKAPRRQHN